ncbi:hypothetical protein LPUS_08928 [Lasallia pustulata]|uniref:Uncharacterized protein n=1 Tax=Lasallia pustulata TaxID=136370 RepID=A0A1W5D6B3_9LECA|nr:hypothetical protein LPUS_08928 [Lasallia pustulata]
MNVPQALKSTITTPPNSFTQPLLTPPPSEDTFATIVPHILQVIKGRKNGSLLLTEEWASYSLTSSQYEELQRELEKDKSLLYFVQGKLRYDFFPWASKFVIRMLTLIHQLFLTKVVREITRQLETIALGDSPSSRFAQDIEYGASTTIDLSKAGYGRHDPDGQFQHLDTYFPGVVVEVAYSQKKRDLWRLADDYILGSDGSIRVVVGLNIEYRAKHATLSIWRPRVRITDAGMEELSVEQTVIDHVICDEDGTPNPDPQAGLRLQLVDFATQGIRRRYPGLDGSIFIPSTDLCAYLRRAEAIRARVEGGDCEKLGLGPRGIRRRRDSTPPEQL